MSASKLSRIDDPHNDTLYGITQSPLEHDYNDRVLTIFSLKKNSRECLGLWPRDVRVPQIGHRISVDGRCLFVIGYYVERRYMGVEVFSPYVRETQLIRPQQIGSFITLELDRELATAVADLIEVYLMKQRPVGGVTLPPSNIYERLRVLRLEIAKQTKG